MNVKSSISQIRDISKKLMLLIHQGQDFQAMGQEQQAYLAALKELLNVAEQQLNINDTFDVAICINLSQGSKDVSSFIKKFNETPQQPHQGSGDLKQYEILLRDSLASAERLYIYICESFEKTNHQVDVDPPAMKSNLERIRDILSSPKPNTAPATRSNTSIPHKPSSTAINGSKARYSKSGFDYHHQPYHSSSSSPSLQHPHPHSHPHHLAIGGGMGKYPIPSIYHRPGTLHSSAPTSDDDDDDLDGSGNIYSFYGDFSMSKSDHSIQYKPKHVRSKPERSKVRSRTAPSHKMSHLDGSSNTNGNGVGVNSYRQLLPFILESKDTAYKLRARLVSYQKESLRIIIRDLENVEIFYEDQIKRINMGRLDEMSLKDQEIQDLKDKLARRDEEISGLRKKLKEKGGSRKNSVSNGSQKQPMNENLTLSEQSSLEMVGINESEEIDYNEALTGGHKGVLDGLPNTDQDARSVENLLNAIEERKMNNKDEVGLPTDISVPVNSGNVNNETLPRLDTIGDKNMRKIVAATQIQRIFRGYSARKKYKKAVMRKHIAREIFETEVSYVKGLLVIYKQYVIPLRFKAVLGEPIIQKEKIETIFFHIREIMALNHTLLGQIERRVQKWNLSKKIGDIFVEYSPSLEMYANYVNNYNKALATYEECCQTASFKYFLQEIRSKQEKRALGLLDLLITPIQRIPRYVLLLKELLKHTDKSHVDYTNLLLAISRVQKVAEIINERKRESERFSEVLKIQSKIQNCPYSIAQNDRKLLLQGELVELTEIGKKKMRQLFLFNDILICTVIQRGRFISTEKAVYDFKWSIKLSENQIGPIERIYDRQNGVDRSNIDDDIPPYAIGIRGGEKHILLASSPEELEKWLQAIADARLQTAQLKARESIRSRNNSISEKFVIKKYEVSDVDFKEVVDISAARRMIRDRLEQVESDIRIEAKVLYGLQRLNQVYSQNSKTKSKVSNQKEETTKVLNLLQAEAERLNELHLFVESLQSNDNNKQDKVVIYMDRKTTHKAIFEYSGSADEKSTIKVYEVLIKQ